MILTVRYPGEKTMSTKIFSILLMGILLGTCCTVIGTQQQNDTITQPQTNKQNPTKEITAENECGCGSVRNTDR